MEQMFIGQAGSVSGAAGEQEDARKALV